MSEADITDSHVWINLDDIDLRHNAVKFIVVPFVGQEDTPRVVGVVLEEFLLAYHRI